MESSNSSITTSFMGLDEDDNNQKETSNSNDETQTESEQVFHEKVITIEDAEMSRDDAIDKLIHNLKHHNFIDDEETLKEAVLKRESESTTAIGMNVAIPHAKSNVVKQPVVAVLNNKHGVEWKA